MHSLVLIGLIAGCSNRLDPVDTGVIPNPDTDADTDADTDSDTDTDTDADGPQLDCNAVYDTPVPGVDSPDDECVTERVYCGDVRFGTTEGGSQIYDYDFWLDNFLISNMDPPDIAGEERIYTIENVPAGDFVSVNVQSCDPVRASWYVSGDLTDFCETGTLGGPKEHFFEVAGRIEQETELRNVNGANSLYSYQIIVDAPVDANTNYLIQFECGTIGQ